MESNYEEDVEWICIGDGSEYLNFPPSVWELKAMSYALGAPPENVPPMFGLEKSAVISDGVCDIP